MRFSAGSWHWANYGGLAKVVCDLTDDEGSFVLAGSLYFRGVELPKFKHWTLAKSTQTLDFPVSSFYDTSLVCWGKACACKCVET